MGRFDGGMGGFWLGGFDGLEGSGKMRHEEASGVDFVSVFVAGQRQPGPKCGTWRRLVPIWFRWGGKENVKGGVVKF